MTYFKAAKECEVGQICVISIIIYPLFIIFSAQISKGCFPEQRQSRAFKHNNQAKYITLNEGQLWASKPNLSMEKGQSLFSRSSII